MTCKNCIHCEACERMISDTSKMFKALLSEILKMNCDIKYDSTNILSGAEICQCFQDRSRFVELPFEQNKGASPFDKVAHTTYTLATESHRVASFTIEGYYLMYNEERLYTLEKDGIVILVQGSSSHDVVEKAKLAIEKLSKEREANANDLPQSDNHS